MNAELISFAKEAKEDNAELLESNDELHMKITNVRVKLKETKNILQEMIPYVSLPPDGNDNTRQIFRLFEFKNDFTKLKVSTGQACYVMKTDMNLLNEIMFIDSKDGWYPTNMWKNFRKEIQDGIDENIAQIKTDYKLAKLNKDKSFDSKHKQALIEEAILEAPILITGNFIEFDPTIPNNMITAQTIIDMLNKHRYAANERV
jgi:hypothetical protein